MSQVFPGSRIKIVTDDNPNYDLYLKVKLEVHLTCAVVSLIVMQHKLGGSLLESAWVQLVDLRSILLFKERLDLSAPSDLVGGLSLVHQAYGRYYNDWMDNLGADLK